MDPSNKVWIITGAASGLGLAVVQLLNARAPTASLALLDLNQDQGEQVAGQQRDAAFFRCDVGDEDNVKEALEQIRQKWKGKKWGGVVHCGGVGMAGKTVGNDGKPFSFDIFSEVHRINLLGSYLIASHVAAEIVSQHAPEPNVSHDRGVIILTSSVSATEGQMGQVAYGSSKAAVEGLVLPMARDLARHGIRVMCIAPSLFSTSMGKNTSDRVRASLLKSTLYPPRFGESHEYAQLALQIIENGYLNGNTIRIDGGSRMSKM
ncbi:oxidoreductase [Rhodotorula sp. JG-1b]|nr:oxidoreductase [Rhodotorula sp. JG-1b]